MSDAVATSSIGARPSPTARRLALLVAAVSMSVVLLSFVLALRHMVVTGDTAKFVSHQALLPVGSAIYLALGVVVIGHQPRNAIGWIFLCVGALYSVSALAAGITTFGEDLPFTLPRFAYDVAAWLDIWVWLPAQLLPTTFLLLLFPDGRLPSPRWWPVAWAAGLGLVMTMLGLALLPGPSDQWATPANPFGVPRLERPAQLMLDVGAALTGVGVLGSVAAVIIRCRRSQGVARQQMKWLAYSAIVIILLGLLLAPLWYVFRNSEAVTDAGIALTTLAMIGIAVAATIAIVREGLYDIDLIINRTLVYGLLTAAIVGLYFVLVVGTGTLLQTGNQTAALLLTLVVALIVGRPLYRAFDSGVGHIVPVAAGAESGSITLDDKTVTPDRRRVAVEHAVALPESSRWARLAWFPAAALATGILLLALPGYLNPLDAGPFPGAAPEQLTGQTLLLLRLTLLAALITAVVSLALTGFLYTRKSHERIGLFLAYYLLAHATLFAGSIEMLERFWPAAPWVNSFILLPLYTGPLTITLVSIFPDGRFVPRWTRWLVALSAVATILFVVLFGRQMPGRIELPGTPAIVAGLVLSAGLIIGAIYAQVYRFRRVSGPVQRQQTKWVLFGLGLWIAVQVIASVGWIQGITLPSGSPLPASFFVSSLAWAVSGLFLPLALTFAVMRYRLFALDIVVNRTLVFGALTVAVILIYGLVVGVVGALFQTRSNWLVALLATGLVAVLFNPLRERLQRWINRLIYGQRDEPFEVLAQLGQRLEGSVSSDAVYPTIVETVAQTLRLPYAAIETRQDGRYALVESYGKPAAAPVYFPLLVQGEEVGRLLVGTRSPGESLTPADERLLRNVARQASAAVRDAQLTAELQRSRQQIVTSREEERRRLRRDLHDGLGPALASLHLEAGVLRRLIREDPEAAVALVEEMQGDIRATVDDIRRLVYELRPPALDDLGFVPALQVMAAGLAKPTAAASSGLSIRIDAPDNLPSLPAAVEVAAYRIIQEALTNVVRHARAGRATVRLRMDGADLLIEVIDDGAGYAGDRVGGLGLRSMRERAAELGGSWSIAAVPEGTRVTARLPTGEA